MSHLDPLILQKLQAFAQRRRKLIVLRGICAAIAMLLATMMIVALVDWLFVLDDWLRWTLSGIAYAAVLIAEWRACLRLLVQMPDPRRLARLIEHAEPKLREDLLSAVELGQGDGALDSAQFRQLVQTGVASRMEGLDVSRLLPVQLLRRSLIIVTVVLLVCAGALTLTGFQFGTSMIRALLPMLNLARVSKVQVHIIEPNPADETIAQGDAVPLLIEIGGQRTNKATLEIFTKSGGRELVPMNPSAQDQFAASIQVAREDIEYRIRAGDAMTRKYHLHAAPRPHIVRFFKTYHYPEYSKLPPKQVTEESGDLAALEQSKVDLELETDQPAKEAELRMERGKDNTVVPLTVLPNGHLSATVPLDRSGIYRVHLVAASTGFENKFSPEYELRADPDLVPQIEIEKPEHDLILPANEIVDFTGTASDDLAVDRVEQQYRVNGGEWKTLPIAITGGAKVKVENRWDLMQQGLKAGDTITTKLVAYDLKKNKGESTPIQITLTAAGFEMKRLQALENQRKLLQALSALRTAGDTMEKESNGARDQFAKLAESDPQRKQAAVGFDEALGEFEREEATAVTQLVETSRETQPGNLTSNFVMLARLLAKSEGGEEQYARDNLNLIAADPAAPFTRDLMREAADHSAHAAQRARLAQESCRTFVAGEEIDVLNENFQVVSREQERIANLAQTCGEDAAKWAQLTPRLRVVLTEAHTLGELMAATAAHAPGGVDERLRRAQKRIDEQSAAVDKPMAANTVGKEMLTAVTNLSKSLTEIRRMLLEVRSNTADGTVHAYAEMAREVGTAWSSFDKLRQESEQTLRSNQIPAEPRAGLATQRWNARSGLFKSYGDAEEGRSDADNYFVSDVRMLTLALDALRGPALSVANPSPDWDKAVQKITTLDQAFRVLESGHNLAELISQLDHLAAAERWEFAALRARTSNARDWRWSHQRMRTVSEELGRAQLASQETAKIVRQAQQIVNDTLGKEVRPVEDEMGMRFRQDREPVAVSGETQAVAVRVREALELLRKPMEEARKALSQFAPSLSELAAQLAQEAEDLKKKSADQAEKVANQEPEKAQSEAKQELAAQQKLNDKVDAFRDALRADAGKQDLLKQEGREHARDVDDALAMLHDPPPRAEQALNDAVEQERTAAKQDALKAAAGEQQKLADALNQVSKHFDALEKGESPQDTRTALREAEKDLGVKEQLDQQYANAEQLAELAGMSPEEMLKKLEKALPQNPAMQQELSAIAQAALTTANTKLADASNRENNVARDVQKLADQQEKQRQDAQNQQQQAMAQAQGQTQAQTQQAPAQGQQNAQNANTAAQPNAQNPAGQNQTAQNAASQSQPQAQPGAQNSQVANPSQPQPSATAQNQQGQQGQQGQAQAQPNSPQSAQSGTPQQGAQAPNPQLAQAAKQQPAVAHSAGEAGEDIQRAGRHEERLQNTTTGKQLQQLGEKVQKTAQGEVPAAQQALTAAQMAAQAQAPVNTANANLQNELAQLNQAAQAGQEMANQAGEQQQGQNQSGQPQTAQNAAGQQGQKSAGQKAQMAAQASHPESGQQANAQANAQNGQQQPGQASGQQQGQNANGQQAGQQTAQANASGPQGQAQPNGNGEQGAQPPANAEGQGQAGEMAAAPPTPAEQTWMARMLDALDAALHSAQAEGTQQANAQQGQAGQAAQGQQGQQNQQGQQGQQGQANQGQQSQGQGQPGQQAGQSDALAQAQQAMKAAAQANSAAMRSSRAEGDGQKPAGDVATGEQQAVSKGGVQANVGKLSHKAVPDLKSAQGGDWGHLPKKMAEQLSQGQRENVPAEYRNQIETYYRVIAERAKKE